MTFVRVAKKENPFVQLDKAFIEDDSSITWKAKGILSYILSRPDNWQIRYKDLVKRAKDGKDSVESAMAELMAAGYIYKYQERAEGGKFGEWVYQVYERPEFNPNAEKGKNEIEQRRQKRKSKKSKTTDTKAISPKPEKPVSEEIEDLLPPKPDFPEPEKPEPENPVYNNKNFSNTNLNNNNSINHHHHKEDNREQYIEQFVDQNKMTDDEAVLFFEKVSSCKARKKESVFKYCEKTLATVKDIIAYRSKPNKTNNGKRNTSKDIMPKWHTEENQDQKIVTKEKAVSEDQEQSFEDMLAELRKQKEQRAEGIN